MTLKEIALRNLMRRKGKAAFILAGLVIGVSTVVAIISLVEAMTYDINEKLEKYGANILVVPKSENLTLMNTEGNPIDGFDPSSLSRDKFSKSPSQRKPFKQIVNV